MASRYSLQNISFTPLEFKPAEFTPAEAEFKTIQPGTLSGVLARQEEREQKAAEQIAKDTEIFANLRKSIHQDAASMERFNQIKDKTMQQLYDLRYLDPDEAIKSGMMLGADIMDNAEIQGMIRNNQDLTEENKKIDERRDIDDITKRRFKKQNEESFASIPQYDDKGNIIGTHKWKPANEPVADVNPLDLAVFVSKIVAPDEDSSIRQRGGKTVKADSSAKEYTTIDGKTVHVLTADRLHAVYDKVEESYPGYFQALTQNYENQFFRLEEIEEQLKSATGHTRVALENEKKNIKRQLYTEDGLGVQRTPEEYRDYQLGVVLDEMAYERTDNKNVREWGNAEAQDGSGSGRGIGSYGITGWPANFGNSMFGVRPINTVNMNFGNYGLGATNTLYNGINTVRNTLTLRKTDVLQVNGQWYDAHGNPIAQPAKTN